MDNAGENIYIEQAIRSDLVLCEMGTVVEYTAPYTPQQNGKVEQAFPTLFSRARALCNGAKLPTTLQKKLFCEAFRDAVQKDAILYTRGREAGPPYNAFFRKNAPYVKDLHSFGEIGICYIPSLGYNRTSNKGRIGLYLNLPINHPRHTFKFFNPYTKKVFTSRNVTWTGLTWGEYKKISPENYFYKTVIVLDSDEENEDEHLICQE